MDKGIAKTYLSCYRRNVFVMKRLLAIRTYLFLFLIFILGAKPSLSQSITSAEDDAGTIVSNSVDNPSQFNIEGGTQAGTNLFHSFDQFGIEQGQVANFLSNPDISNVLGRVVGGKASIIDGLLQVTGGPSNLFLMNPAGIIFGQNAQFNLPADFTATTANGIQLEDSWFQALGSNDYADLFGDPNGFSFETGSSGAILNAGSLSMPSNSNIRLIGGMVVNTGTVSTSGGNITIEAIPESGLVTITPEGSLLSLGIPIEAVETQDAANEESKPLNALSLPQILSQDELSSAAGVIVEDGVVRLTRDPSSITIPVDRGVVATSGTLDASNSAGMGGSINMLGNRIYLVSSTLTASGDTGGGSVRIGGDHIVGEHTRDSSTQIADQTFVSRDSVIDADATSEGNGGDITIRADGNNLFQGSVSAQGTSFSGEGGNVGISGKEELTFDGSVELSASWSNGTLLLDYGALTVVDSNDSSAAGSNQISWEQISMQNGDVTLEAAGEITISDITGVQSERNNLALFFGGSLAIRSTGGNITFEDNEDTIYASANVVVIEGDALDLGSFGVQTNDPNGIFGARDEQFSEEDRERGGSPFLIKLTANSGDLATGNVSSESRMHLRSSDGSIRVRNLEAGNEVLNDEGLNSEEERIPDVRLEAPNGSVTVETIYAVASPGSSKIVSIQAGESFRATDTFLVALGPDSVEGTLEGSAIYEQASIVVGPGNSEVRIQHGAPLFQLGSGPAINNDGNAQYREILSFESGVKLGDVVILESIDLDTARYVGANGEVVSRVLAVPEPVNVNVQDTVDSFSFTAGSIAIESDNGSDASSYNDRTLVGAGLNSMRGGSVDISSSFEEATGVGNNDVVSNGDEANVDGLRNNDLSSGSPDNVSNVNEDLSDRGESNVDLASGDLHLRSSDNIFLYDESLENNDLDYYDSGLDNQDLIDIDTDELESDGEDDCDMDLKSFDQTKCNIEGAEEATFSGELSVL
ncbi:MAG: filamentous hemagglutinin N-terminal domain-containing protein [Cyanobacteria bacterium J06623_4]